MLASIIQITFGTFPLSCLGYPKLDAEYPQSSENMIES